MLTKKYVLWKRPIYLKQNIGTTIFFTDGVLQFLSYEQKYDIKGIDFKDIKEYYVTIWSWTKL